MGIFLFGLVIWAFSKMVDFMDILKVAVAVAGIGVVMWGMGKFSKEITKGAVVLLEIGVALIVFSIGFAIFAAARNEKHIIEWLNYYIKVGFDYFYIFDDLSDKPIEEVFNENNIDKKIYSIYRKESNEYLYENINSNIQNITYSKNFWMNYFLYKDSQV